MAILNFPNTRPNGDPLQAGDTYLGDNGVNYTYDGVRWLGRTVITTALGYTGSIGYTGSQGIQGLTGLQGNQGLIGNTGTQGIQGIEGLQGPTGLKGDQGLIGNTGTQGIQGSTGTQGIQGLIGPTGNQGIQGSTGTQGPRGFTGEQGISVTLVGSTSTVGGLPLTGNAGDGWIVTNNGDLWFWSTINAQWEDIGQIVGPQGATGDQGPQGAQGPVGNTGTQGPQGPIGLEGPQGPTGLKGDQGLIGNTGTQGIQGIEGPQGPTGAKGDQGLIGNTGTQGAAGYTGSMGNTGTVGYTGSIGISGYTGSIGTLGYTGSKGADGGNANTANFIFTASQVSVSNDSDITLVTNANTWTFGSNGTLTLPDGTVIDPYTFTDQTTVFPGYVNSTTTKGIALTTGEITNTIIIPGTDFTAAVGSGTNTNPIAISGKNGVSIAADSNNWTFGADGTLTFPGGDLTIGNSGGSIISAATNTTVGVLAQGPGGYAALEWISDINSTSTITVAAVILNSPFSASGGTVQIATGLVSGPSAQNIWEFGTDGTLTAPGHLLPNADLTYDLGSTTTQWRSIYVGTGTIFIGGVALGVNQDNFVTVDGNPIITVNTAGNLTVQGDVVIGTVTVSETAPTASTGTQWFNTVDGRTYIAYNGQWLDASPVVVPSPGTYLGNIDIDGDTLNINGNTLIISNTGTLLVNGSEVTGSGTGSSTHIEYTDGQSGYTSTVDLGYNFEVDVDEAHLNINGDGTWSIGSNNFDTKIFSTIDPGNDPTVIVVRAGDDDWTFGPLGWFTLPGGSVIKDGMGAIRLEPWGASSATQALLIYPTAQDGNHIHLTAGGGETDLYLGNDIQYVKVDHSGDVVIGTLGINTSTWTFGTDGVLTLSTASTILGNSEDPNVYIETSTTATTSTWSFGTDGVLTLPASTPVIKGGGTGTDVTIIASNTNTTSTWVFAADGTTTLPSGATLGAYPWPGTVALTAIDGVSLVSEDPITTSGWVHTKGSINALNGVLVQTRDGSSAYQQWLFGTDGNLTFPDTSVQTEAWNDANFMAAMLGYDGEIITNTATIGVGGLVVNGPVTFNGPFTYQTTATTAVTGNTGTFYGDVNGVGALYAGVAGYSPLPSTVFQSAANVNAYIQNNFQNLSNGTQASAEWVATANNGDDSNHYLDMGIAGGGWDGSQSNSVGTAASANDSWVYAQGSTSTSAGGNLILGTIKNGKSVKILTGSTGSSSIVATFNGRNTNATTTNSGSLQVVGGVGISQNLYAGTVYSNDGYFRGPSGFGSIQLASGGALYADGIVLNGTGLIKGPAGYLNMTLNSGGNGAVRFASTATIAGTTNATSTTTGALIVQGGAGIARDVYVGGNVVTPNLPAFRVYGVGSTTITVNTTLTNTHYSLDYQQGGTNLVTSTGIFTAPVAGLYQINIVGRAYSNAGVASQLAVIKNYDTTPFVMCIVEWAANTTVNHMGASTVARLAAGSTLVLKVLLGSVQFDSNDSWSVAFLG